MAAVVLTGIAGPFLCAGLAASLLVRRLAGPVRDLSDGAARIGSGDLAHRIAIATDDEFRLLGESFNRMAARLEESYALLESKVEERTAELALARDTALAKSAEAERAKHAAELANETRSRFLAVFSHEIRTPLNGIIGILQILERRRPSAAQRRLLDMASSSGATLVSLVDAILDYARLEAGTETVSRSDFDVMRLLENAIGLMARRPRRRGSASNSSTASRATRRCVAIPSGSTASCSTSSPTRPSSRNKATSASRPSSKARGRRSRGCASR